MAYPNSFCYDPFYRPDPPFHPPSSLSDFNEYIHPTNYSFSSYHPMSCHHCQDPNHSSEQCPSIGYSLGPGQNQFHTFQGPTSEPYPSNFNSEGWNCPQFSWDQSYQNSQPNWSYIEPPPPSWGFNNEHEESTLEKSFKAIQQTIVETNQQLIEACAHMDKIIVFH